VDPHRDPAVLLLRPAPVAPDAADPHCGPPRGRLRDRPGKFRMPHQMAFDSQLRLCVAHRGNPLIQNVEQNGTCIDETGRAGPLYFLRSRIRARDDGVCSSGPEYREQGKCIGGGGAAIQRIGLACTPTSGWMDTPERRIRPDSVLCRGKARVRFGLMLCHADVAHYGSKGRTAVHRVRGA